jgi:DNA-binding transcriptional LysR family regulator
MELRQLRYFVAIAQWGSLVEAANVLRISQPALSKSMRALEGSLGVRLFKRQSHGVALTDVGAEFLSRTQLILAELDRTKSDLDAMRSARGGEVHIGALRAAANTRLPVAAARFSAANPGIRLRVEVDQNSALIDQLLRGRFDVVIGAGEGALPSAKLHYEELWTDRLAIVSRAGHPLHGMSRREACKASILARQLWIMPDAGYFRTRLEGFFFSQGVQAPEPTIVCAQLQFVRSMLCQGDYLALLPQDSIILECRYGELVTYPVDSPFLSRSVGLITRRNHAVPRSCQSFVTELRGLC